MIPDSKSNNAAFAKIIWGLIILAVGLIILSVRYNMKFNQERKLYYQNYEKLKKELILINNQIANTGTKKNNAISFQNSIELYNYFANCARSSQVNILKFALVNQADSASKKRLPLEMELLGDYPDFISFFKVLNPGNYDYAIERVVFAQASNDLEYTTKVYLKVNVPVMKGGNRL